MSVAVADDPVAAGMEDERAAPGVAGEVEHLADHDHVVAGAVDIGQPAVQPAGDSVEERCAGRSGRVRNAVEGGRAARPGR